MEMVNPSRGCPRPYIKEGSGIAIPRALLFSSSFDLKFESFLSLGLLVAMASAEIEFRCFVGGLAWATDNEALERAFSQYGEIIESKVRLTERSDLTRFGLGHLSLFSSL